MVLDGFGERAEDDAVLLELGLEGRGDRDAVEDGVYGDPIESLLLEQRDAELVVGLAQLGIELVEALDLLLLLGRRVVDDLVVVDRRVIDLRPFGLGVAGREHLAKARERLEPIVEEPFRLVLLGRDQPHHAFGETRRRAILLDLRDEAVFVILVGEPLELGIRAGHLAYLILSLRSCRWARPPRSSRRARRAGSDRDRSAASRRARRAPPSRHSSPDRRG